MRNSSGFRFLPLAILAAATILLFSTQPAQAVVNESGPQPKPFVVDDRLEVQFTDDVSLGGAINALGRAASGVAAVDAVFQRHGVTEMRPLFPWRKEDSPLLADRMMSRFQTIRVPSGSNLDELIDDLLTTGKVVTAEKIWAHPLAAVTPNDPQWGQQYAPAKIGANQVWDNEFGSDTAKLALADSGVLYYHPDLKDKVWVNPGEDLDGDGVVFDPDDMNGVDDDGNGIVDDLIGYDFFTGFGGLGVWPGEDGGGLDNDPKDFQGHGTHCAGIAAAATDNSTGVAGIGGGFNAGTDYAHRGPRIMCLRIGGRADDGQGYVTMDAAAAAIDYAAKNGADVVSWSWGSSGTSGLFNAIQLAHDSGVVICVAAGNANNDEADYMPLLSQCVTVASTTSSDIKSGFSSYGSWVEISAPGSSIRSTYSSSYTPSYAYLSGTSMATPAYAGCVLLVKSLMPSWTEPQIDSVLIATADDIDGINPTYAGLLGSGRVNVWNAIQDLPVAAFSAGPILAGEPPLAVDFTDESPNSPTAWSWTFGDGGVSTDQNPNHVYTTPGLYDVTLTATEPRGDGFEQQKHLVLVHSDTLGGGSGEGLLGDEVIVPVNLKNDFITNSITIPVSYPDSNGASLTYNSFSLTGTRTANWVVQTTPYANFGAKELVIQISADSDPDSSHWIQPGNGPVINLHFTYDATSAPNSEVPVLFGPVNGTTASVVTAFGAYDVNVTASTAILAGCCDTPGDADNTTAVNIADVTYLIARIFSGGPAPVCQDEADADGSGAVNIADVTYLIGRIFSGGPTPICGNSGF